MVPGNQNFKSQGGSGGYSNNLEPRTADEVKKDFKSANLDVLVKDYAEKIAKAFYDEYNYKRGNVNKNAQIRKFYDELSGFKQRLDSAVNKKQEFDKIKPLIFLIASKVAYAKGRNKVGNNFYQFVSTNIFKIDSYEDLSNFLLYFEAILGYYKFLNPKES